MTFGKWFLLLNKRLYKKLTFLLILVLIPVLLIGYGSAAQEESGILTIALARRDESPLAQQVMQELKESSNLIRFVICDSPEASEKMVSDGKADAAWILADDLENRIYRFIQAPARRNAFVRVVEPDNSVPLKLAREKLSGTLFKYCSREFYLRYIRKNVSQLADVPDAELMRHYDEFAADATLFEFAYLESDGGQEDARNANYLLTPIRGLLAIVIVLGGLAAAMYYIRDEQNGTFSLVPQKNKSLVEFACQIIAVLNIAVVALIALGLSGLMVSWGREVAVLLMYALGVALFCMTVRRLCGTLTAVGTALPLLVVVMLVVCPIFFDLGALREIQYIFPPTYYINAVYSNRFLLLMMVYSGILLLIYWLAGKIPGKC